MQPPANDDPRPVAPPPFVIRPATAADLPAVAALAARLVRLHHAMDPLRFMCVDGLERGYERFFRRELPQSEVVLNAAVHPAEGEAADRIVGYAYGRIEARDWNNLLDACGALHDIYVDDDARGTGLAEALLRATLDGLAAKGAPRVVLHSAHGNVVAQKLFERVGFRRTMVEMTYECAPTHEGD